MKKMIEAKPLIITFIVYAFILALTLYSSRNEIEFTFESLFLYLSPATVLSIFFYLFLKIFIKREKEQRK
jgi:hypothetical protein